MVLQLVKTSSFCVLTCCLAFLLAYQPVFAETLEIAPLPNSPANSAPTTATESSLPEVPLNLTISPVTLTLEAQPGQVINAPFKIKNNGTEPEKLQITLGTFTADETGQRPKLLDPKPEDTFMAWLTVDQPTFELAANEWKTVTLTFSPPADAALSYFYTVKVARTAVGSQPGQTVIHGAPALLVLTTVKSPNVKKEMQLTSFRAMTPIVSSLPQTFEFTVNNTGNVHAVPTGTIFIDGEGKKDIAVLPVNPGNNTVLPSSQRAYTVTWSDPAPENPRTGVMAWLFGQPGPIRWGKYTAHLLLVYDNGERDVPIESFVSFWVIPWQTLLTRVLLPIIPAIGVYLFMRWRLKRQLQRRHDS